MTPFDIKNAAHAAAVEGSLISIRRGTTSASSPEQLGKIYNELYRELFTKFENFLRERYGYPL